MRKTLRDDLILEACEDHPSGCYIRFRPLTDGEKVHHTKSRGDDGDVVVDYDIKENIIGIEFYYGLGNEGLKK